MYGGSASSQVMYHTKQVLLNLTLCVDKYLQAWYGLGFDSIRDDGAFICKNLSRTNQ